MPLSFFLSFFFAKATGRTVRQIWTNEGSKRVVPRKEVPRHRLSAYGRRAFAVAGPTIFFNTLPDDLRDPAVSTSTFGQSLKTYLFSAYQHV